MLLANLLREHSVLGLDTAIFIYHFEKDNQFFPITNRIFHNLQASLNKGISTIVSLAEILVKPMELKNVEVIEDYKNILNSFPNLTILDLDQRMAITAAYLRAKYKIELPDALQIAGSITKEATLFITNDQKLTKVKEIKVVTLNNLLKA